VTIYDHDFIGEGELNGTSATSGSGAWQAGSSFKSDGAVEPSSGQAAWLPFTPRPGYEYTATASILIPAVQWMHFGFMTTESPAAAGGGWTGTSSVLRHTNNGAHAWVLVRQDPVNPNFQGFNGHNTNNLAFENDSFDPGTAPATISIVLNTMGPEWTASY